jgi:Fe-S cluster assembly scaffold protein SufB
MSNQDFLTNLYHAIGDDAGAFTDLANPNLTVHHNCLLNSNLVDGLTVDLKELASGIDAKIVVTKNRKIARPIYICFGMLPEKGLQQIILNITIEENAKANIIAYCVFPNAVDIRHEMDAVIHVEKNAEYSYLERHVHGKEVGVAVIPKSKVIVNDFAKYKTDFELIKGRVGEIDLDLEVVNRKNSITEATAKISGAGDDNIKINEFCSLQGELSRGILRTKIALRDRANADIQNRIVASAAGARGHIDCKEIIRDDAIAKATPIVKVNHPQALVTHEAAIGTVDSKQLETLMSRGLSEDAAVDAIIKGMLS